MYQRPTNRDTSRIGLPGSQSINPKIVTSIEELKKEIDEIKARNKRVEADKAWETSWTRKFLVLALTYIVIVIFFFVAKLPNPFANAVVPSVAFVLSTLTVPIFKKWWLSKIHKQK